MNAIGAERGELLRRNVEWRMEISDTLFDGYFTGDDDPPVGNGQLCVTASCSGCGYFRIGAALDSLEREAAGLGAAFYRSLVDALYRVMRIYDYDDALMYEEQLRDYISEDDTASPGEYEFPEVKKALPASSSRRSTQSGQLPDNGSLLRTRMAGMVPGSAGCVL